MALKQWMKKCEPLSIYIVLTLTMFYFLLQLIVSYISHALTLTIDSYLMLCNLIALFGCIITIKTCDNDSAENSKDVSTTDSCSEDDGSKSDPSDKTFRQEFVQCSDNKSVHLYKENTKEKRLKNTFGWARVDVLVMLSGCVAFASLCFSTIIEAVQTLLHISHTDQMHYPKIVFYVGAFGLVMNGLSFVLIGGYTFHHGSCLRVTSEGVVVLEETLKSSNQRKLNLRTQCRKKSSAGAREICRDVIGCIFVMIVAVIVSSTNEDVAKLADPICSIISAIFLIILSFPYMKESCFILLQTIPNHINIDSLCKDMMKEFPAILNVHDLHVWQFTKDETFFTAHIIFLNPQVYIQNKKKIKDFFHEQGITTVTIQPEFFKDSNSVEMISSSDCNCLIQCLSRQCYQMYCCDLINPEELESIHISNDISLSKSASIESEQRYSCHENINTNDQPVLFEMIENQKQTINAENTQVLPTEGNEHSNFQREQSHSNIKEVNKMLQTDL